MKAGGTTWGKNGLHTEDGPTQDSSRTWFQIAAVLAMWL